MTKYCLYNNFILYFQVYFPGDPIEEGDELTFDKSAYQMYHAVSMLWIDIYWL